MRLLALAGLASLRNRGRRPAAYGTGLVAAMLGVASVFRPTMSGLDPTWSALAILRALALVGACEWSVRGDDPGPSVASMEKSNVPP